MPTIPFGLSENPFVEGHDARFTYPSRAHREVVARLRRSLESREPLALVTGVPGVGKTTAIQAALAGAGPHTVVRIAASPSLSPAKFRERILSGFAADASDPASPAGSAEGIEARLQAIRAGGRVAVLVVDEAQDLDLPLLEELRLLSNLEADGHHLLQILLAGQSTLDEALSHPGCDALRQRIAVRCRLGTLSAGETEGYIRHRVSVAGGDGQSLFTSESCQSVHRLAHGIPREINLLAAEALTLAHTAGESAIAPSHIACAVVMLGFRSAVKDSQPTGEVLESIPAETVDVVPGADADPGPGEYDGPGAGLSILRDVSLPASCAEPPVGPAEESPVVRAEVPVPPPSDEPPAAPRPVGPAAKATPARLAGPEVDAWLARFRDPGGPPRIGSRLAVATTVSDVLQPRITDATEEPPAPPAPPHDAGSRRGAPTRRRPSRGRHHVGSATLTTGALLLAIAGGLVLAQSSRSLGRSRPSVQPTVVTAADRVERTRVRNASVVRPSLVPLPHATAPARPHARVAQVAPSVPSEPRRAPAPSATSPAQNEARRAPAPPVRLYGVEVATYISESRALEERDRLAARISLPCRVVDSGEDGYAIVAGPLSSIQEATRLSVDLSERRLVGQARVVPWAAADTTRR
jgi:type II secretory pathway predicted ATPase ExeA